MRVLMISKACIVGEYQSKLEALARKPDVELTVVVPPFWRDERGIIPLEKRHVRGYELIVAPMRFNGQFHLHHYPTIRNIIRDIQPDLTHIDEEPYNFATFHALHNVERVSARARSLFFTWQNLLRRYPPPFSWMEKYAHAHVACAIAGSDDAKRVLRTKGFTNSVRVIPQFGVDVETFHAFEKKNYSNRPVIGYVGRLVKEKGVDLLLPALSRVESDWELRVLGSGPLRASLQNLARTLNLDTRVHFDAPRLSADMPAYLSSLDLLVLPSISRPNWTEQFGRVLIEAMACGVPVIGSSAGEIPNVVGDAGLIFPEGDVDALANAITRYLDDHALREEFGKRGRERVQERFTQQRIADDTYAAYRELTELG